MVLSRLASIKTSALFSVCGIYRGGLLGIKARILKKLSARLAENKRERNPTRKFADIPMLVGASPSSVVTTSVSVDLVFRRAK
jgi:hypothetical protein